MKYSRLFSIKTVVVLMMVIGILLFSPENLYSQAAPRTPSAQQAPRTTPQRPTTPTTPATPTITPAQQQLTEQFDPLKSPSLVTQAVALTLLSLSPFIIMILTSFLKIVVVLSLLRSALGVQQA